MLEIEISAKAISVMLLQNSRPIAFKSKNLSKAWHNYSAYERELFAIIHVLCIWKNYLYGAQFEIIYDHKSIKWFLNQQDLKV